MELTQNFLRGKNPCAMGYRWFVRNNLAGGDYQAAMDTQVAAGRVEDARWLLENFGSTNSVLELEHLEADNFVYAGTLIVHGDVRVPGQLLVGRSLQAGGGIRAGKLEAGEDIQCGGAIFAAELLQAGGSIKAAWSVEVEGELRAEDLRCGWELSVGSHVKLKGNAHIGQQVQVQGDMDCGKGLKAGGTIEVQGLLDVGHGIAGNDDILCGNHIQTGWGIKAQGDIRAACSIRSGETLQADGEIAAGPGYGVFAGMNVQMQAWPDCAWVRALKKPEALISGFWENAALTP
ncbi:hypothetical protein LZ683_03570 [Comamonas testosteroni]|uniref:hypothetical protein n=1 Tax=Comamonas testosteroni TaxID=285 RepID=UPI0023AAFBBB|nr:hypothetical protein [Comamonas testosteroni]WEE78482.1 hypothetical protein LZ683_03570 [Comamonas testosteroni]